MRRGFVLEILVLALIVAVLVASVIPQLRDARREAQRSAARFDLQRLQAAVRRYGLDHQGRLPEADLMQLTLTTDLQGHSGVGADYRFGPYLKCIPANPFNGSSLVVHPRQVPPSQTLAGAGWFYDALSGGVWLNHVDYLSH